MDGDASRTIAPIAARSPPSATPAMNREEFAASTAPGRRRSRLHPFAADLLALQAEGYTLGQLRAFLAGNEITSCTSNIHRFLARQRRDAVPAPAPLQAPAHRAAASPAPASTSAPPPAPKPVAVDDVRPGGEPAAAPFSVKAIRSQRHNLTQYADSYRRNKVSKDTTGI